MIFDALPDPLPHLGSNQVIKERQTENKQKNNHEDRDMVGLWWKQLFLGLMLQIPGALVRRPAAAH